MWESSEMEACEIVPISLSKDERRKVYYCCVMENMYMCMGNKGENEGVCESM